MPKRALVILAEGFEEVEAIMPIDLLRRADIEVVVAGLTGEKVKGAHGLKVTADIAFDQLEDDFDCLILHGGTPGTGNLAASSRVKKMIQSYFKEGKLIAAICGAPAGVLEPTGILKNKRVTGFPGSEKRFGGDTTFVLAPVVTDGNLITSRGLGTAHAFGLAIIEYLEGKEKHDQIAQRTLFD